MSKAEQLIEDLINEVSSRFFSLMNSLAKKYGGTVTVAKEREVLVQFDTTRDADRFSSWIDNNFDYDWGKKGMNVSVAEVGNVEYF